jgi:hypothetical protein
MNRKLLPISVLLILALVTMGCGLFGKSAEPTPTTAPTKAPEATNTPKPTDTPEPSEPPAALEGDLGEEYRSEEGGFAFQAIPDYTVDEFFGMVSMVAPNANPELGPAIMMMGGVDEGAITAEEMHGDFVADIEAGMEVSEPREVTVDGVAGLMIDVSGPVEGEDLSGRVVFVAVSSTQTFSMIGAAPSDRWEGELEPLFDTVLATVTFFEPGAGAEEPGIGGAETRQWAISAEASSEYDNPDWAAIQATGAPDTFIDECADLPTAWASLEPDTVEWLELGYDIPVIPTEVNIIQTHSPDQVVAVELIDTGGTYHTIYTGQPTNKWEECPYTLSISVEDAAYQAVGVRITIDQSVIDTTWNEIDAVELVGYADRPGIGGGEEPPAIGGGAYTPDDVAPGSFIFEVTGAGEDAVIDGGVVQDNSSYSEYGVAFVEEGTLARYSMTIYVPFDVTPGEMTLKPYVREDSAHAPSAVIAIGMWLYLDADGTLVIDEVTDDTISGSFFFTTAREDDPTIEVTVAGAFNQVPLGEQ